MRPDRKPPQPPTVPPLGAPSTPLHRLDPSLRTPKPERPAGTPGRRVTVAWLTPSQTMGVANNWLSTRILRIGLDSRRRFHRAVRETPQRVAQALARRRTRLGADPAAAAEAPDPAPTLGRSTP